MDKIELTPKNWYWLIRRGIEHPIFYSKAIREALFEVWIEAPWRYKPPKPINKSKEKI